MKKLYAVVFLFVCIAVFVSVWFSPLGQLGEPRAYFDNTERGVYAGLCYPCDETVRVDFYGSEHDMYSALDSICAKQVKSVETDGLLIVYAHSPRVCNKPEKTLDGKVYNVMAAYCNGKISIGTPLLSGCY